MPGVIVFLCRCCGRIEPTVDLTALRENLDRAEGVAAVEIRDTLCLPEDRAAVLQSLKDSGADRILVVACSPYGKAGDVVTTLSAACGGDRSRVRLVDIREGCAWIHRGDPAGATAKAGDLIRMNLGFLRHGKCSADAVVAVQPECLVLGAGPAGLAAALGVARAGRQVHLVDRAAGGGMVKLLSRVYPTDQRAEERINPALDAIAGNPLITFHAKSRVAAATGFAGDFRIRLASGTEERNLRVGAVILATGSGVLLPKGLYRYGELKEVLTLMELERRHRDGKPSPKRTVFIQCVGSRCPERPYCATICCPSAVKNAALIRRADPESEVTILHRDIMMPGHILERYYRSAMEAGVRFIRFAAEAPPVLSGAGQVERVDVLDAVTGVRRELAADQVILSTPLTANADNAKLAALFGIETDRYGFFREDYPLHPLETRQAGVFICGSARWPVASADAAAQGEGAAMKALAILGREKISARALSRLPEGKLGHARIENSSCSGCGNCVAVCPYEACTLQKVGGALVSRANKMRCRACGSCTSVCPNGTIQMPEHNARAVGAMIRRAFSPREAR
ncbi:MAG: FAD-dependent oxidoreductase [Acidobacteriota bacterium]|nr:FAD-dependent oxidoreductase [Acidobacteriota bacterium]